jgi:CubicO group peptidase (beta-lactamase class C family)
MKMALFLILGVILLVPSFGRAESIADDPRVADALKLLEVWVDSQVAYESLPGVSMGVVYDQDLIWSRGFGYADVERKTPATPTTMYSICSISKLFTSIGVMQLRDEGKLRLDDPLGKHLPWFEIQEMYPEAPEITIRGILTHSSGLPRESDHPYWTGPDFPFPTREEIIERISNQQTLYPAERFFQYSNLGLTLATNPEIPDKHRGARLATGYTRRMRDGSRKVVQDYLVRGIAPAAGYASTVEDLAKFASWQFSLLENGGREVLSANTLREMQRVHWVDPDWETTWGLGFAIWRDEDEETTFVGHGGSCPGYRTQLAMSPKDKIAVVFMTNGQGTNTRLHTGRAFEIVAPAIAAAIEEPGEGKKADPELLKYVGRYDWRDWGETQVVIKDGDLAVLSVPTDDPVESLIQLKRMEGHIFRRVREDDEDQLGEEIVFELDPDGNVERLLWHGNYAYRVP